MGPRVDPRQRPLQRVRTDPEGRPTTDINQSVFFMDASISACMQEMASTIMSIMFTTRQHRQRVTTDPVSCPGIIVSLHSLERRMYTECKTLMLALGTEGGGDAHIDADRISGLSRITIALVRLLTRTPTQHALTDHLVASLLVPACVYVRIKAFANPCDEAYCTVISDAMRWVIDAARPKRDLHMALAGNALVACGVAVIWQSQNVQPLVWMSKLRPRCFLEQVFCLIGCLPLPILPLDVLAVSRQFDSIILVGHTHVGAPVGEADWLMGPCLIHAMKKYLIVSLHQCVPTAYTDNLLTLLHNCMFTSESRCARVTDDVYLRDLVLCTEGDGARFHKTADLAYSVVHEWPEDAALDDARQASVMCILCLLTSHALRVQERQRDGVIVAWSRPRPELLGELIRKTFEGVFRGTTAGPSVLKRQVSAMQQEWGILVGMEAVLREMRRGRCVEAWRVIDAGLTILHTFTSKEAACVRLCASFAATLRKMGDPSSRGAMTCMTILQGLQPYACEERQDIQRLMAILAMIITGAVIGSPSHLPLDLLRPELSITHMLMQLLRMHLEVVPDRRGAQRIAWGWFAVEHLPNLLPGCGSMACKCLAGSCEAALPTRLCGGCRRVRYCCDGCQRDAWLQGGHMAVCHKK